MAQQIWRSSRSSQVVIRDHRFIALATQVSSTVESEVGRQDMAPPISDVPVALDGWGSFRIWRPTDAVAPDSATAAR
jgi:hypothetical protein